MEAQLVFQGTDDTALFLMKRSRDAIVVTDPTVKSSQAPKYVITEDGESTLLAGSNFISTFLTAFRRDIEQWGFFNIDPNAVPAGEQRRAPS